MRYAHLSRWIAACAFVALCLHPTVFSPYAFSPTRPASPGTTALWTVPAGTTAYAAPTVSGGVLARLPGDLPVRALGAGTPGWASIALFGTLRAWVPRTTLQLHPGDIAPSPSTAVVATPAPPVPLKASPPMPFVARMHSRVAVYLRTAPSFAATRLLVLPRRSAFSTDAWATDAAGAAWFHVHTPAGAGWLYGDALVLDEPAPTQPARLLDPFRGKGMWFTYGLLATSPVTTIVAAAHAAGLTHLYVEVARSNKGYYGEAGLRTLLPVAHRAGIRVIAWVYPFLRDLPSDVTMSLAAARATAPGGDKIDGLVADVEENMSEVAVRAYGQLLRATLGPNVPLAIATYPPQWAAGKTYPFATAALTWNVIIPMDYWHLRSGPYSAATVYSFVAESINRIRAVTSPTEPIEVLGQMFDLQNSGRNSPTAPEIAAAAAAARAGGALGVSFFEWAHATPDEWDALAALP